MPIWASESYRQPWIKTLIACEEGHFVRKALDGQVYFFCVRTGKRNHCIGNNIAKEYKV